MIALLDFGKDSVFIWATYAVTAFALLALVSVTVRQMTRASAEADRLNPRKNNINTKAE